MAFSPFPDLSAVPQARTNPSRAVVEARTQLARLSRLGIQWFDDNAAAWYGPSSITPDNASAWGDIRILSFTFKGIIGGKVSTKMDVKQRINKTGATLTNNGRKSTYIDMTLMLYTAGYLASYIEMINGIFQINGTSLGGIFQPVAISHPSLALYKISQLYLAEAGLVQAPHGGNPPKVTLRWHEFIPSQQVTGQNTTTTPTTAEPATVLDKPSASGPAPAPSPASIPTPPQVQ